MKKKSVVLRNRNKLWILPLLGFLWFCWSCEKDNNDVPKEFDPLKPVVINELLPDSGGVGTQLVLKGENFGNDKSIVEVVVNEKKATVIGVTDSRIYAVVPARAGTGTIKVTIQGEYNAESDQEFIYKLSQNVSTVAGITDENGHGSMIDGSIGEAAFLYPYNLVIDDEDNMFVVQRKSHIVTSTGDGAQAYRYVELKEGRVSTKLRASGEINKIRTLAFNRQQDTLWCMNDANDNNGVGLFTLTREQGWYDLDVKYRTAKVNGIVINPVDGSLIFSHFDKSFIRLYNEKNNSHVDLMTFGENYVIYLCFSPDGKTLYMAVNDGFEHRRGKLYKADYDLNTKTLSNGELISIDYLDVPEQIACDDDGNLYICDSGNHTIEMYDPKTKTITTFAGVRGESGYLDGIPSKAKFNTPTGICIGADGAMYVADNGNHRIRKIVVQ